MVRSRLIASVAVAPLLMFAAGAAHATTTISDTRTTPVTTATVGTGSTPDDISIAATAKFKLTTAGPAVTVNSSNSVTNLGDISTKAVDGSIGIKVIGGNTGTVLNQGTITLDDDYTATDTDKDGDLDGVFAQGTGRYGIQIVGPGAFTGNVTNDTAGVITVTGNNSYGISLETALTGNLVNNGSITVTGNNDYAIRTTGTVSGNVILKGGISATGGGSTAVSIESAVGGGVVVQGSLSATGYRYTTRPATKAARDQLEAEDMQIAGPALQVTASVANGILLDIRPPDRITDVSTDTNTTDEDHDGVADSAEGTATLSVYGSAPGLLIGSTTQAVNIGVVPEGTPNLGLYSYGLVIRGAINSDGVYDGVSSTGLQIGQTTGGQTTTLAVGARISGAIVSTAYGADSTGMVLNSGATAPTLFIDGGTVTANVNEPLAALASTPGWNASAVLINAGATVDTINNGGTLTSTIQGVNSTAYAIRDLSGSVTTINNTRIIQAAVLALQNGSTTVVTDPALLGPKLYAVAIDVSANTTGVTLNQTGVVDVTGAGVTTLDTDGDGVYDTHEPLVFGQVRFGTGNDTFNIQNGSVYGNLYFNTGNDALVIGGANSATVAGTISHGATGNFDVTVNNGTLTLGNIGADTAATAYQPATTGGLITGRNLVVGAAGQLVFTANPTIVGQQNGEFSVQTANLATGAKIGMQLTKLITNFTDSDSNGVVDNAVFTVIHTATPGGLTVGAGIDGGLVGGNTPFLYKSSVKVDAAAGNVDVVLTLRNTTELGLNAEGATIFNSFYTALGGDSGVTSAILAQTTQKDFLGLYNQFLPNQGQGIFSALDMTSRAVGRVIADKPDRVQRYGPDSVWVQEINADVMRDAGVGLGSNTKAFGFVGGYESMGDDGGALGATLAYVSAEESDKDAQVGEQTSVSVVEASVYWRRAMGNFLFSARGAGGYVWFDGDRRFVFPSASTTTSVLREYDSGWTGYTLAANASAAYETTFGRFYLRPQINLDYFYLNEGSYSETGGSNSALALDISGRTSNRLSASAELAFGATFGRDFWWRPEIRVGYRETISSNLGELNAQFQGGGSPFLIQPDDTNGGAAIIAMALKAGTAMSYVAVEGELEALDSETRYNLRLEGRMMF